MPKKEYIECSAILKAFDREPTDVIEDIGYNTSISGYSSSLVEKIINSVPAADARENKRGKWVSLGRYYYYYCSNCENDNLFNGVFAIDPSYLKFCPNCGSEMIIEGRLLQQRW